MEVQYQKEFVSVCGFQVLFVLGRFQVYRLLVVKERTAQSLHIPRKRSLLLLEIQPLSTLTLNTKSQTLFHFYPKTKKHNTNPKKQL